ncbi:hypothetical protein [Limnohabitans sp.]|uniref:hypothetical protein n=1 Tax=Limnohabitans sp. TaxID=1907725 RepID=UPI0035AFBE0D
MDERDEELLRTQQARQQAEVAIRELAKIVQGGAYLVSDFRRRDDLPATASLRRMSNTVAKKLAALGLREPVSLQSVPNRWWKVKIDAAEVGLVSEYGCAMVTRMLSTDALRETGFEVEDGPFRAWENDEVSRAILNKHPGGFWDARIYRVDATSGHNGRPHFSGEDNGYTSEALIAALERGDLIESEDYDPILYESITDGEAFDLTVTEGSSALAEEIARRDRSSAFQLIRAVSLRSRDYEKGPDRSEDLATFMGVANSMPPVDLTDEIERDHVKFLLGESWDEWPFDERLAYVHQVVFGFRLNGLTGDRLRELRSERIETWLLKQAGELRREEQ